MSIDLSSLMQNIMAAKNHTGGASTTPEQYRVRISGSPDTPFQGQLKVVGKDGAHDERPLQGQAPLELTVTGCQVELALQCQGAGSLRVEIFKAGQLVSTSMISGQGGSMLASA